jgi:hypothetical protein
MMRQDNAPDDLALVEQFAREMLGIHGARAVPFAQELAEVAEGIGDGCSAGAWRDIAMCAADLF